MLTFYRAKPSFEQIKAVFPRLMLKFPLTNLLNTKPLRLWQKNLLLSPTCGEQKKDFG